MRLSALSFLASLDTSFVVVAILCAINAPALHVQAATGLLAIVVLPVIMNWFFHKFYWTGWIQHHNRLQNQITQADDQRPAAVFRGLVLLAFTVVYREGFEIVPFLQSIRLKAGNTTVLAGVMPGGVLLVMVGEQVQEMQQAGWIGQRDLSLPIPDWMGTWFALLPNVEGIAAQALAAVMVIGSFCLARRPGRRGNRAEAGRPGVEMTGGVRGIGAF